MKIGFVKYLVVFVLISSCSALKQKQKNLESFKEMAFCNCLEANYSMIDSTFAETSQDFSLSVIFSERSLSPSVWDSLRIYSSGKTYGADPMMSHTTSQIGGKSNFISLACLEFYKSKELEKYIKRLMKEDK